MPDYPNKTLRSNNREIEMIITHKESLALGYTKRVFHNKQKAYALGHYMLKLTEEIADEIIDEVIGEMLNII